MAEARISFPRQFARTRRFTLGKPRSFAVARNGSRVAFLRSKAGDDPVTCLWALDVETGFERLVCDPREIAGGAPVDVPPEERARRERVRESADGIVAYAIDPEGKVAALGFGGRLFVADMVAGRVDPVPAAGPVVDPRPDPTGRRVAYVRDRSVHVVDIASGLDRLVVGEDDPAVSWGLAEFVAAEEMGRTRGFWWSPGGERVAVARVDTTPVQRWHIADPAEPSRGATPVAYPVAGTPNAQVSLSVVDLADGRADVDWDREAFPYLARVVWTPGRPLTLLVQSRDQRVTRVLMCDPVSGRAETLREDRDDAWLELVDGLPAWLDDGRLVFTVDRDGVHRLVVDGRVITPPGLHLRGVVRAARDVLFTASQEPTEVHVWRGSAEPGGEIELTPLTERPGVHGAAAGGDVVVLTSASMEEDAAITTVLKDDREVATIRSFAERPALTPSVTFLSLGRRELRSALLLPTGREGGSWPVLLDPYGGPSAQRVVKARAAFLQSQWFADQGFAVLVTDGRGTPARGTGWERSIHRDFATAPLQDQVDALHAAAERDDRLDPSRVAIRGWSFGGYLAALAVLRRPDVFHAAVAGAPVTDWRLYDTHYTERYLGDPNENPDAYLRSSLLEDAAALRRPLMLIHGLADDNVVVAHTLRLSRALLEAGRPHTVLPLSGVTHMTPQEAVAENLLLLQVAFLRDALGMDRA